METLPCPLVSTKSCSGARRRGTRSPGATRPSCISDARCWRTAVRVTFARGRAHRSSHHASLRNRCRSNMPASFAKYLGHVDSNPCSPWRHRRVAARVVGGRRHIGHFWHINISFAVLSTYKSAPEADTFEREHSDERLSRSQQSRSVCPGGLPSPQRPGIGNPRRYRTTAPRGVGRAMSRSSSRRNRRSPRAGESFASTPSATRPSGAIRCGCTKPSQAAPTAGSGRA